MYRVILLLLIFLLSSFCAFSQVREIKKRSNSNKQSTSSSESSSSGSSGGGLLDVLIGDLIFGIIKLPFKAAFQAQNIQADKFSTDPWRVSFEGQAKMGVDFRENTMLINPVVRGNYGLFSTQIRYNSISDVSGGFGTIDWQILQMNFVNNEYVRFIAGFGVSNEVNQNQSYPEVLLELSGYFADRSIIPTIVYRKSGDGYPRREFSSSLNYRPNAFQKVTTQFSLGYTHQRWYDVPIHFISAGIGLIIQ